MGDALPMVDFGDSRKVMQLTMGNYFQCAIFDTIPGEAKCWGTNYYGQLGIGMESSNVETNCLLKTCKSPGITMKDGPMLPFGPHVVEIQAGANQVCVRLDTGDVKCWGEAHYGLGYDNGAHNDLGKKPEHMTDLPAIDLGVGENGDPRKAAALFAEYTQTCVILDTVPGDLKCWGDNRYGQCGYDHKNWIGRGQDADDILMKDLPVVDFGTNSIGDKKQVASYCGAADHSCAILDSIPGDVVCWGINNYGQLGMGVKPSASTPLTYSAGDGVGVAMVDLVPLDFGVDENGEKRKATAIKCGRYFNCAMIAPDNALFCWGNNGFSVCGLDSAQPTYAYTPMMTNMKANTCPTGN
jgi:alpha-tubulin suppressor-like RCC1 family protein